MVPLHQYIEECKSFAVFSFHPELDFFMDIVEVSVYLFASSIPWGRIMSVSSVYCTSQLVMIELYLLPVA
jgi:hypothetical protein